MDTPEPTCLDRRCLLTVAAAGATTLLAGCSTYDQSQPAAPASAAAPASSAAAPAASAAAPAASGAAPAASAAAAPAVKGIAALADVPVGGGKVLADAKIVLTQPTAGNVKAFSAVCTHAGCTVVDVSSGTINCPCHGSRFSVTDGSVVKGPAPTALAPVAVTVKGDQIVRT
jgi:Rieske Fe-S protein